MEYFHNRALISLLCCYFSFSALAKADEREFATSGAGNITCKQYISYSDSSNENDKILAGAIFFWIQGYMSGVNVMNLRQTKDEKAFTNLNSMSTEEQQLFLHIFCRKNQEKAVFLAADSLFWAMSKK